MHEARRRARASAEKRRTLTAGSGQKLGGSPVVRGQDIRKVIADAATRRAIVTKGCASGTDRSRGIVEETTKNGFRTKAEEEDANEEAIMQAYIELIQEEEREKYGDSYLAPSNENPAGSQGKAISSISSRSAPEIPETAKSTKSIDTPPTDLGSHQVPPHSTTPSALPDSWTCEICTLSNPLSYLCCDACGTERSSSSLPPDQTLLSPQNQKRPVQTNPQSNSTSSHNQPSKSIKSLSSLDASTSKKPLGWICQQCGTFMETQWWTCSRCGQMKSTS